MRGCLLFAAAVSGAMTLTVHAQAPVPVTPESLVTAAKRAAGLDYAGHVPSHLCGARQSRGRGRGAAAAGQGRCAARRPHGA